MKNQIIFLLLISPLCNSLNAQAYKGVLDLEGIVTPILTELDKVVNNMPIETETASAVGTSTTSNPQARANNNNNSRSNKDKCCRGEAGGTFYNDDQEILFDASSQWYSWSEPDNNTAIPNPIAVLGQLQSSWVTIVRDAEGTYVSTKMAYTDGLELLLNTSDLDDGGYYIEIFDGQTFYRTAFQMGDKKKSTLGKVKFQGIQKTTISAETRNKLASVLVQKTTVKESGKIVRSAYNHNNGGRLLARPCCDKSGGVAVPTGYDALGLDINSHWRLIYGQSTTAIPNPIPYFNSINSTWTATLANETGQFLEEMQVSTVPDEMLVSIADLSDGIYILEIEYGGNKYRTNFTIGAGPPASTVPSSRF